MVSIQKTVLNTSLRCATKATDSTCKGCKANRAATKPLLQIDPVILYKTEKSNNVLMICSNRFVQWYPPAFNP